MIIRTDSYKTEEYKGYTQSTGDKNLCTVVALSVVTGNSLADCNKYMLKFGRRFKKGMDMSQINKALESTKHFYFKKGEYSRINRITINQFIKKHPVGVYYCIHRGHAFAIKDGVLYDHTEGGRRQIYAAWRVYTKDEINKFRKNGGAC